MSWKSHHWDVLLGICDNGGLDFSSWDDLVTWLAILVGFFFLLRCSEYLRKGALPDAMKCVKERNLKVRRDRKNEAIPFDVPCDEALLHRH